MRSNVARDGSQPDQLAHDITGLLKLIPVGRTKIYEEITSGRLKSFKIGDRRFVRHVTLVEYLKTLEEGADPGDRAA